MIAFFKKIVCVCCVIVFSVSDAKVSVNNVRDSKVQLREFSKKKPNSNVQKLMQQQKAKPGVLNKRKLSDLVRNAVGLQKLETSSKIHRNADSGRVVVDINEGVMKPVNIALHICGGLQSVYEEFLSVIRDDLQNTGLFRAIPNAAFMQNLQGVNQIPDFDLWRIIKAEYLVNVEIKHVEGRLSVGFALYAVSSSSKIHIFSVSGGNHEWRKMAHKVANAIYERVVGEVGYFDTKVLYVATEKDRRGQKKYRLALMDQYG